MATPVVAVVPASPRSNRRATSRPGARPADRRWRRRRRGAGLDEPQAERPTGGALGQLQPSEGVDDRPDVSDVVEPLDLARPGRHSGGRARPAPTSSAASGRALRSSSCRRWRRSSAAASSGDGSTVPPPACSARALSTPRPPTAAARIVAAVTPASASDTVTAPLEVVTVAVRASVSPSRASAHASTASGASAQHESPRRRLGIGHRRQDVEGRRQRHAAVERRERRLGADRVAGGLVVHRLGEQEVADRIDRRVQPGGDVAEVGRPPLAQCAAACSPSSRSRPLPSIKGMSARMSAGVRRSRRRSSTARSARRAARRGSPRCARRRAGRPRRRRGRPTGRPPAAASAPSLSRARNAPRSTAAVRACSTADRAGSPRCRDRRRPGRRRVVRRSGSAGRRPGVGAEVAPASAGWRASSSAVPVASAVTHASSRCEAASIAPTVRRSSSPTGWAARHAQCGAVIGELGEVGHRQQARRGDRLLERDAAERRDRPGHQRERRRGRILDEHRVGRSGGAERRIHHHGGVGHHQERGVAHEHVQQRRGRRAVDGAVAQGLHLGRGDRSSSSPPAAGRRGRPRRRPRSATSVGRPRRRR